MRRLANSSRGDLRCHFGPEPDVAVPLTFASACHLRTKLYGLFVGHGEDAVPAGRRFVEEIFLAALPVGARRPFIGPLVQYGLKSRLSFEPQTLMVKRASFAE